MDAEPRTDADFLTYRNEAHSNTVDNHINGDPKASPFLKINFPMVSDFVIDTMHTVWNGAFGGALQDMVHNTAGGKLSAALIQQTDARLKIIEKCTPLEFEGKVRSFSSINKYKTHEIRRLGYLFFPVFHGILHSEDLHRLMLVPYGMQLFGGFNPAPVPPENVIKAKKAFRSFNEQTLAKKYPCRYTMFNTMFNVLITIANLCK